MVLQPLTTGMQLFLSYLPKTAGLLLPGSGIEP